ncbi:MAG: hypothetical protein QF491_09225, partial [Alphaproteobacteria bacterium]|nr:hypothetical protein [Alphaproteobacteria bacterium]
MTQSERSSGSPILARGYLVWANGLPIPGAAIEIHEKSDQRLGQSVSGDGGYFAVPLDRRHGGQAGLRLLLRGGRCGRELYSAPLRIDADGRGGKSRFVVPARVRRDFTPTAVHIPRRDGGILSEGPRETIEKALNKRFAGQPEQLARSLALMRRSIPFLARVGELPAIAWRVLDGERPAAAQLRGLLLKLAGAGRQFSGGGGSSRFMSAAQAAYGGTGRPLPDSPMGFQGPCAFDPFGFAPVAVATLRIADSITDWEYLAGGLEVGLFGSGQFDSLFQGAQEFLGNGDDTDLLAGLLPGGLLPPAEPDYPEGPGLGDPYFDLDDCMIRPMECLAADVNVAILPDPDGQAYQITAISPDDACAGEQVEITGQFFGSEPQKVVFPKCEGSIVVDAVSWSENQVIAVVPEDATPGQLGLKIPRYTMQMCGHYITVSELGATLDFHGGRPWIDYLTVAGDTRGCL